METATIVGVLAAAIGAAAAVGAAAIAAESATAVRRRRRALRDLSEVRSKLLSDDHALVPPRPGGGEVGADLVEARRLVDVMLRREAAALEALTAPVVRRKRSTIRVGVLFVGFIVVMPLLRKLAGTGAPWALGLAYVSALSVLVLAAALLMALWGSVYPALRAGFVYLASGKSKEREEPIAPNDAPRDIGLFGVMMLVLGLGGVVILGLLEETPVYPALFGGR